MFKDTETHVNHGHKKAAHFFFSLGYTWHAEGLHLALGSLLTRTRGTLCGAGIKSGVSHIRGKVLPVVLSLHTPGPGILSSH